MAVGNSGLAWYASLFGIKDVADESAGFVEPVSARVASYVLNPFRSVRISRLLNVKARVVTEILVAVTDKGRALAKLAKLETRDGARDISFAFIVQRDEALSAPFAGVSVVAH